MSVNILDINNDCLLEIFKKLTVSELAAVASTCIHFRTVARHVFSYYHKSTCLDIEVETCQKTGVYEVGRRQAATVLRNFGDLIKKLKVNFGLNDWKGLNNTAVFNLMSKYCTGEVERLELACCRNRTLQLDKLIDATSLFRNVKELVLNWSHAINASFLSEARQLIRLQLYLMSEDINKFLSNDYPQLQSLSLDAPRDRDDDQNEIKIVEFLKRHPNVFDLELRYGKFDFSSIDECQSLRKLSISYSKCDYMAIAQLENLTTLKSTDDPSLLRMLQTSKSLETLEEFQPHELVFNAKDLVAALLRFTNLTRLSFIIGGDLDDDLLSDLHLHGLKKLRVLSIGGGDEMSITSKSLVDLVRRLPDLKRLCLNSELSDDIILLKESTYLRLCDIYRSRNKKLVISNFELGVDYSGRAHEEPFAGGGKRQFVQCITDKGYEYDARPIVEI